TVESPEGRAALFETADNAFDAMIDLQIRASHADSAFGFLERERAAAKLAVVEQRSATSGPQTPTLESVAAHVPDTMLFVEYAVLRDRTIAWTATRRGTGHYVIPVARDTIAALVAQFMREASIPGARPGDARSRLFDILLGPLSRDLERVNEISVVCDRELAQIPFAALWDSRAKAYVIERYRIRTEPSAAFLLAAQSVVPPRGQRRTALVVGNPALDSTMIQLDALPGAEREARTVAKLYSSSTLLIGADARRDTVVSLLRTPKVFHFAGHAVFNGDRPELSYLALGSPRGRDGTGALEAREISQLRLSNLEIVVLSACRTLSSRSSRTGAVAGLASSFLRAGAPAIISTLWDVSDDVTEPLLATFHRHFAEGVSAADALRSAQLEAIAVRSGQRAAPAAWAAFIYAGP
ncbi:MAG: CHAT domain-containing protein, partial [Gemmatimonadaceae bacterium]